MAEAVGTRRGLLAAAGGAALVASGCGGSLPKRSDAAARATALGLPEGELSLLRKAVILEHAQLDVYDAVLGLGVRHGPDGMLARFADVERSHVAALEAEIRRDGGTPPLVATTLPRDARGLLDLCEQLEQTAARMWTWFAQRAVGLDVRAATSSIMAVELRQLNGLRVARGTTVLTEAPAPLSVDDAVRSVAAVAEVA